MAERRPSLMEPRIETLMGKVDSKFTLVTLAAMRAREINDYYNQLGEGLGRIVPPQVTSVSRKPLSIALEEIAVGKIVYERIEEPEAGADEAAAVEIVDADARRVGLTERRSSPERRCADARVVLGVCGGIAAYKAVEVCRRLVDAGVHVAPGPHRRRAAVRRRADVLRARVRARAHLAVRRARADPAHAARPDRRSRSSSRPRPRSCSGSTRPASPTTCSPRPCSRRARRCSCARRCTPRCGSTRRCRRTSRRCAGAACTCSSPRRAASRAATSAPAGSPIPARIADAVLGAARGAAAPLAGPHGRRDRGRHPRGDRSRCASSATGRRGRWATRSANVAARRGAQRRARHHRAASRSTPGVEVVRVESARGDARRGHGPRRRRRRRDHGGRGRRLPAQGAVAPRSSRRPTASPRSCSSRPPTSSPRSAAAKRPGQVVVGFAAETERLRENAAAKLAAKRVDLMVANDVERARRRVRGRHQPGAAARRRRRRRRDAAADARTRWPASCSTGSSTLLGGRANGASI